MPHVFLSDAREDLPSASRLYDALTSAGYVTWLDKKRLLPGQRWKVEISSAIRTSDAFIALLSQIGMPVTAPVSAAGRVKAGQLPAATVARTVYHGPYEGVGPAWAECDAWVAAEGHTPGPDFWERYVTGPESNTDPGSRRTELNRPLRTARSR